MSKFDYWKESVEIAFNDYGIVATKEQIEGVARDMEGSHENIGQAFYQPPAGEHLREEINNLKRELEKERRKEVCPECKGKGRITTYGPYHSGNSECMKCRGNGKC